MRITLEIPDNLAAAVVPPGQDPSRAALEAIGLEAYRRRRMSGYQLRDGFLKAHEVEKYTIEDFEKDLATIRHFEELRKAESRA
jgi:hypothetical protein